MYHRQRANAFPLCDKDLRVTASSVPVTISIAMSADENLHWSTEDCTIAERKADQDEDNDVEAAISDDMRRSLNDLASRLCTTCRDFLRGEIPGLAYRVYHPSVSSLEKSVEAGCSICKDLSESLGDFCKQLRPPSAPIETWSIECEMFVFNSWHMPEGYKGSNNAFRLSFRLRGSDGASVIWDCRGISDFANMCFYPVDGLSLGPEFLGMSTGTPSSTLLLWLMCSKILASRKVQQNRREAWTWHGTGTISAHPTPRVGIGERNLEPYQPA